MPDFSKLPQKEKAHRRYITTGIILTLVLAALIWPARIITFAQHGQHNQTTTASALLQSHSPDFLFETSYSHKEQPYGPLVVYRAINGDLRDVVPVVAVQRSAALQTPLLFPSPDGRYVALVQPHMTGFASNLNGAALSIFSTDGQPLAPVTRCQTSQNPFACHSSPGGRLRGMTGEGESSMSSSTFPGELAGGRVLALHIAAADQIIWSSDSRFLYYHSGVESQQIVASHATRLRPRLILSGYDEIHRVDLAGHDVTLYHQPTGQDSLRLVGLDRTGNLILTLARPHMPVELLRLTTGATDVAPLIFLPPDILPGNVLQVDSDGESVLCERILSWQPLRYITIRIAFADGSISRAQPLFDTSRYGRALTALARSGDGALLAMARVLRLRDDLAAQGITNVPAQEALVLANGQAGALQTLTLPYGGQLVQAFWTQHHSSERIQPVPRNALAQLLPDRKRQTNGPSQNASVFQQDEWMLEGHNGRLADAPALPQMCYGLCSALNGAPHVSAAILHGVAYTESNWHQFNSPDYSVDGEQVGTPVESFDGGWGEYQQTWGMPPQCISAHNCRGDVYRVQHDQSYNIGVGIASLINAWNSTAGVASSTDPNDPFKSNDWFFSTWAYNGSFGNNPDDVPSSVYAHWYPGAPFRSIYEEYVWYYAAHPQFSSNGWTDNYVPSLGPALLPPQGDFSGTSDSFVACGTCTIPDWTSGSYDRAWVGYGAPDGVASALITAFAQLGGESVLGLPRDNGGGAPAHRWGNGWAQDFGGGSDLPGALLLADGTTSPYWVHGGVWVQYLTIDHGVAGCHGYPNSNLAPFNDPGRANDTTLLQTFQRGSIEWDATTGAVVNDVCS